MDLVQFGVIPTIDRLISKIQGNISAWDFHHGLSINYMFVTGDVLLHHFQKDCKFLEDLLLMNLRKMNLSSLNDIRFYHQINSAQVTKVEDVNQNGDNKTDQSFLVNIVSRVSPMYDTNINNRVIERFASRTYAIKTSVETIIERNHVGCRRYGVFDHNLHPEAVYLTCNQLKSEVKVENNMLVPIVRKGTPLVPSETSGEDINIVFTIFNYTQHVYVGSVLHILDDDEDTNWDFRRLIKKGEEIITFECYPKRPSYPIIFKARLSQTGSYKFWVEYDENTKIDPLEIQESNLLKTYR